MVFIKKELSDSFDEHFDSEGTVSTRDIKQGDLPSSENELDSDTLPLSEEAMAWNGLDMAQLENIFNIMRDRFQRAVYNPDNCDPDSFEQDTYYHSGVEKLDLQDACCFFLEQESLPRVHRARANLMMVWLIETETECERYAKIAEDIIEGLESDVLKMFGGMDDRVEELWEILYDAQKEVARRNAEAGVDEDEDEDEEDEDEDM